MWPCYIYNDVVYTLVGTTVASDVLADLNPEVPANLSFLDRNRRYKPSKGAVPICQGHGEEVAEIGIGNQGYPTLRSRSHRGRPRSQSCHPRDAPNGEPGTRKGCGDDIPCPRI